MPPTDVLEVLEVSFSKIERLMDWEIGDVRMRRASVQPTGPAPMMAMLSMMLDLVCGEA